MKICINCKIEKADDCFYAKINQCKECKLAKQKQYNEANKEEIAEKKKQYHEANKEKLNQQKKQYYQAKKQKASERNKQYINNRLKTDFLFKFKHNVRTLVRKSFQRCNHRKTCKSVEILGCSLDLFKEYIKSKFTKGMTFENHGEWHLDHIIPLATAKTEKDVIRLNHYTNFQPLWAKENMSKSDKIIEKQLVLI